MKKSLIASFFLLLISFGCSDHEVKKQSLTLAEIAPAWADLTLKIVKSTTGNSPTFTSRNLGYIGLTMYESIVAGSTSHKSLNGQLNGLPDLPVIEASAEYNWSLSLNAGQADILRKLYSHTTDANLKSIDSLETLIY